ncbi:hypothetical protein TWF281_007438 [Arthrobotrys megalospora]
MQILGHSGRLVRVLFSLAVLSTFPNIHCNALSDKFYDDYLEAQSFLRGGIGVRALHALNQRGAHSRLPRCVPALIKNENYLLCRAHYGSSSEPPLADIPTDWDTSKTMSIEALALEYAPPDIRVAITSLQTEVSPASLEALGDSMDPVTMATVTSISVGDTEHHHPGATVSPKYSKFGTADGLLGGDFFNRLEYSRTVGPLPTSEYGFLRDNLIRLEMNFAQLAKADTALASASLYLSYDQDRDTAAIAGAHTASIGTWTTTSTYDIVNISPFPYGPEGDIKYRATADFNLAVSNLDGIYRSIEKVAPRTESQPTLTEALPLETGSAQDIILQGNFFGTAIYNSASAGWNGTWGPYDKVAETLPFVATVWGADGTYTRGGSESWVVFQPFSGGNEANLVKAFAENGPVSMAFRVSLWNSYRFKSPWPPSNSQLDSTGVLIHIKDVGRTNTLLPTARDAATIVVPTVTEVVTKTKTHTNTLIPLFGRMVPGKGTSARKGNPQKGYRFLLWLPWVLGLLLLLAVCTFALTWHRIADFSYRQYRKVCKLFGFDPDSTRKSSFWKFIPSIRKSTVRKVSGSQVIDPAKLQATRQRTSKESFESVELD